MYKLLALLLLVLFMFTNTADCAAKPARVLDASITADADDSDRGVLGVRYAVGMDMRKRTHVIVMNVVPGGPADEAGLKKGDRIVTINGVEVSYLSLKQVGPRMAGAPNTVLELTVKRGTEDVDITLTRGGLTKLPDGAFKSRMIANGIAEERDSRIKALCQEIKVAQPAACEAVEAKNWKEAETQLQRALKVDPNLSKEQLLYALILDRTGASNSAQALFENLVARNPQWTDAWLALALCYEARENYADSIAALKKAAVLATDKSVEASIRHHISELSARGR
jgi:hypothetical protein